MRPPKEIHAGGSGWVDSCYVKVPKEIRSSGSSQVMSSPLRTPRKPVWAGWVSSGRVRAPNETCLVGLDWFA